MHWNVSAIEVQHDFLGWGFVLFNEVMPQQFVGFDHGLPVHALFHPAQGRFARQNGIFTGRGLKCLVSAQRLVIVQVFVPGGHAKDPLPDHGLKLVANQHRITGIVQNGCQALSELVLLVDFAQQEQTGIGGDVTAGEIGFNLTAREWRKG
jgi:hypothetical protein